MYAPTNYYSLRRYLAQEDEGHWITLDDGGQLP